MARTYYGPQRSSAKHTEYELLAADRRQSAAEPAPARRRARQRSAFSSKPELPVVAYKQKIVETVGCNPITIIVGETGSGKTTQIPWFLMERFGRVVCTQPRTVAATAVARRVAEERRVRLGAEVGYQVRLDRCLSHDTRLVYMTEGTLLRIAMSGRGLADYNVVVVDEAHERTVDADILMGLLKAKLRGGHWQLRVVVMSATLNTDKFRRYFEAPLISIPGTLHEITHYFLRAPTDDYIRDIVDTVARIDAGKVEGDVLVFLTGAAEIEKCCALLRAATGMVVLPLYAQLSWPRQRQVFFKQRLRKCVVATNVAETSLTIDGVVFVVDCGYSKQKLFHATKAVESLQVCAISKASVRQRMGRGGRTERGYAYHMYTWAGFCSLAAETSPEVMRSSMVGECLSMLALGIAAPLQFDFIDAPSEMIMAKALCTLLHLGAVNAEGEITAKGRHMARFPVDPRMAAAILAAHSQFGCAKELLCIAAINEERDKLFAKSEDKEKRNRAKEAKRRFEHVDGDHLTLLNVFNAFQQMAAKSEAKALKHWAEANYLNLRALQRVNDIYKQLSAVLKRVLVADSELLEAPKAVFGDADYYERIAKALLCGYFMNVATLGHGAKYWTLTVLQLTADHSAVDFSDQCTAHPSSVFAKKDFKRNWLLFDEVVIQAQRQLRMLTAIQPLWLLEVAPNYYNLALLKNDGSAVSEVLRDLEHCAPSAAKRTPEAAPGFALTEEQMADCVPAPGSAQLMPSSALLKAKPSTAPAPMRPPSAQRPEDYYYKR